MLVNSRPPAQCPLTIPKLDKENLQAAAAASTDEAEPSPPLPQTPSLCGSEDSWAESPLPVSPVLDQQVVLPLAIDLDAEPATDEEVQSYYSPTFGKNIDDLFDKVLGSSLQPDAAGKRHTTLTA